MRQLIGPKSTLTTSMPTARLPSIRPPTTRAGPRNRRRKFFPETIPAIAQQAFFNETEPPLEVEVVVFLRAVGVELGAVLGGGCVLVAIALAAA